MKIKTVIVDDEESARNVLTNLLENFHPELEIAGVGRNVKEGLSLITDVNPDLVFLDVEMPDGTGFDLLRKLDNNDFNVIFVSAYDQYAIKAIRFSAVDYLLKPIDLEELDNAIVRVNKSHKRDKESYAGLLSNVASNETKLVTLPTLSGFDIVNIDDIIYCEADSNYTKIVSTGGTVIVSRTLKEYENLLVERHFIRIHHSTLININHIKQYIKGRGGDVIMSNGDTLAVSRTRKDTFIKLFSAFNN